MIIATRQIFAQHSLRCTQQRMAVYEALRDSASHPTAEELYRKVRVRTGLSLATVYNALDALVHAGLARRMPTTDGTARYDADMSSHVHVRIESSPHIQDVPRALGARFLNAIPAELIEDIGRELGVTIDGVSVQLTARRQA